jgi:hypothetical protein
MSTVATESSDKDRSWGYVRLFTRGHRCHRSVFREYLQNKNYACDLNLWNRILLPAREIPVRVLAELLSVLNRVFCCFSYSLQELWTTAFKQAMVVSFFTISN